MSCASPPNQYFQWLGATTEMPKMRKVELRFLQRRATLRFGLAA
jgi:hypothetical protein